MTITATDDIWMSRALRLARGRVGRTDPNPAVGCIIVDSPVLDAELIGWGVTGDGGRPHAEENALEMAGDGARGAIVYVTLEPCAGRSDHSMSCANRLVAAGVKRVIIASRDSHPLGCGAPILTAAGVEVFGVGDDVHSGFGARHLDTRSDRA